MSWIPPIIKGVCIAIISEAIGIESFSGAYWAFIIPMNIIVNL